MRFLTGQPVKAETGTINPPSDGNRTNSNRGDSGGADHTADYQPFIAEEREAMPEVKEDLTYYQKAKIGADVQAKIKSLQDICYQKGMTQEQVLWTVALVDHESAGTWNENTKGDSGCSKGIAQWNKCAGRVAPKTFEGQADLICKEMKQKYDQFGIEIGVGKHNAPAWKSNLNYVKKVKKSKNNFSI